MDQNTIKSIADELHTARKNTAPVTQFSDRIEGLTRPDAYSVQEEGIRLREADGEKVIGMKMGLTSEGKRKQMNLDAPLYGVLTDVMQVENGGKYSMKGKIHPKIEPEVAFHIKTPLSGKVTREEVLAACSGVYASLEILDSRYEHFKYFSMEDVISDNSSSSHYILGELTTDFNHLDLKNLNMKMSVNGTVAQEGNSVDISGDPVVSVIQLCELLEARGKGIPADCLVLAGAATAAVALEPGMEVSLEVEGLKPISVSIGE
ncbi:MAG: 4-oxalocrotonate decarboxylase [Halobacteriovorax sp.]|nr:4-oxalocrotonate decarboxylase [Halobacteriovorax sp.]